MAEFFFDTSGLAKRYIAETGSNRVKNTCLPASGNLIFIAEITTVEITSAIVRRRKGSSLLPVDAASALTQFDADLHNDYFVWKSIQRFWKKRGDLSERTICAL